MAPDQPSSMNALVLLNSMSPAYREGLEYVLPYLDHLGVPRRELDLACEPLPADVGDFALVIVAHRALDPTGTRLGRGDRKRLIAAIGSGTGIMTFDPALPSPEELGERGTAEDIHGGEYLAETIELAGPGEGHFIAAGRESLDIAPVRSSLPLSALGAADRDVLIRAGDHPLLAIGHLGQGRIVRWASSHWADSHILGPLAGLDGPLWRGLVWAARKPFALRGLPPLVTMRVDDVVGIGKMWERTSLYWVEVANQHGFKPWLGMYPYNLDPEAVSQLRDLIGRGQATAIPHALGRPPRPGPFEDLHYWDRALEVRGWDGGEFIYKDRGRPWLSDLDEFLYYDHHRGRRWSDAEAARGLRSVDDWYAAHSPLPKSRYLLAHFGEVGSNTIGHVRERWGCDLIGQFFDLDKPLVVETPSLRGGPFLRYEEPTTAMIDSRGSGSRTLYHADFVNLAGHRFFNCMTEVRDVAGYEWFPNTDVAATVSSGVRQLRREMDSMALAVLFTHEGDWLCRIPPDVLEQEFAGVAAGIADAHPIPVTIDDGVTYVRATRTSRLDACEHDHSSGRVTARLMGCADVETSFQLFTDEGGRTVRRLVPIPAFDGETTVTVST